jgi:two-component system NtrC family sensor kinase
VVSAPGWGQSGALQITSLPDEAGDQLKALLQTASTGSPSTATIRTPDAREWLVAAHAVDADLGPHGKDNPLATVLVFYPRESIVAIRTSLQLRFAILLAATLFLVLIASLWLARHFSHPIGQLSRAARDVARGREPRPIGIRSDELGDLVSAFEQMQTDLRAHQDAALRNERLAAVGRFVAGIVHEVKNVLAGLGNYVSVLERRVDEDTIKRVIHPMRRALGQLDTLVMRMRELTLRPRFTETDLPSVLGHAVELCESQAMAANVTIHQDVSAGLQLPAADPSMLGQVFLNVLLNAIQATPAGGKVFINAYAEEEHVLVQIRDTGDGFPDDEIDSLVEPFYTTRPDGTGLGLYISKAIVVRHGGTLRLTNHSEGGAIVTVLLPIAIPESATRGGSGGKMGDDLPRNPSV